MRHSGIRVGCTPREHEMWRSHHGIANALPPYRDHGPQAYGPTDGRLPLQMAPRQQRIASIHRSSLAKGAHEQKPHKITVKKLWIVFSTLVIVVGFVCIYFGLRAANGASSVAQDQTTSAPVDESTTASTVSEATTITEAIENVLYELNETFVSDMGDSQNPAFTALQTSACSEWKAAYSAAGQAADSCQLISASEGSVVLDLRLTFTLTSPGVTPTRLKVATQVFVEQNTLFPEASRCLDANIMHESAVLISSDNGLCSRTNDCNNYHVCTPNGTSDVKCSCWEGYNEVANYGCVVNCVLDNCLMCASTTSCMTCKGGYDLTNEGTCQAKCEVDNCASCINPNVCDSCILHYALNTSGESPVCNLNCTLANCVTCASPTSCMTCDTGYELSNGGTCQAKCEVDNCASCIDPNVCDSCILHYTLNTTGESPVCILNCTLANCTTCASPTSCMTCDTGYELSNGGTCQAKCEVDNCASCIDPNVCDSCILHYTLNTTGESPVCNLNCTLANCTTCASPTSCMACDTGYELSNGGLCQAQCEVDHCASCSVPNVCDSCLTKYTIDTSGTSPLCKPPCNSWCTAGCLLPNYCLECPFSYRVDPDMPGNCLSDCPFDNAINTSGHQSVADRTSRITFPLVGSGLPDANTNVDIEITNAGLIKLPTVTNTVKVYVYVNENLHMTSGLFKYRQYTDTDTRELAVAKGYVCNHIEVFELDVDCSPCSFTPNWMLHFKIEDVPIDEIHNSTVLGTLNCEVIVTSDGNENYAAGYFTSEPYGNNGDVEISWGWAFETLIGSTYGPFSENLRKNKFVLNSNVGIPGVWVYKLPTP